MGGWALTNSVGPSLARIMEQCHVGQPIAIIHMAASPQNLGVEGTEEGLPKHVRDLSSPPLLPQPSYLIANDVDLVLDLRYPLAHNGKQLRDGGLRVKQNLLAGRVVGVEEGEGVVLGEGGRCRGVHNRLLPALLGGAGGLLDRLIFFLLFFFLRPEWWGHRGWICLSHGPWWPSGGR